MYEYEKPSFEKLPDAVFQLLHEVADIKNYLLNLNASSKTESIITNDKDLLTVGDVARKLKVTTGAIYNMTHTRQIPHFKKGGRVYFDAEDINKWIRDDRRKTLKQLQEEANLNIRKQ